MGKASGAGGEFRKVASGFELNFSGAGHFLNALEGFKGAEKNRPGFTFVLACDVEAIVIAVDEINIGMAGGAEQDRSAGSVAGGGVGRGIELSEVGFDFDDAGGETWGSVAYQDFADEFESHTTGIAREEGTGERAERAR